MKASIIGGLFVGLLGLTTASGAAPVHATDADTFQGLTPARLLDTRVGGWTIDGWAARGGPVAGGSTLNLDVVGRGGVPDSGVGAVALNVTVDAPASGGYLTVWPAGAARPTASNLNFVAGQTVPNMVIVPVGAGGEISIYNGGTGGTAVLADVLGWFPVGDVFTGLTPARLMDTRPKAPTVDAQFAGLGPVAGNATGAVTVLGRGGVPDTGVGAVALNVTVDSPQAAGYFTVWPSGAARPNASNVNFATGKTVPNMVIVPVGADGKVSIFNGAPKPAHVIVDVLGWFPTGSTFTGLTPARLLDTRSGAATIDGRFSGPVLIEGGVPVNLVLGGRGNVPSSGAGAVALNVTVVDPTDAGYLSVYPLGAAQPNASNLNFTAGQTVANTVLVPLGGGGQVKLYLGGMFRAYGTDRVVGADVIVDVLGWFDGDPIGATGNPLFRSDGLGPVSFGTPYESTASSLSALIGPINGSRDEAMPEVRGPGVEGAGQYWNPTTGYYFPYSYYREACAATTCLAFGGSSASDLAFIGWRSTDERYVDANGVGVGARLVDFPPTGAEPDIYYCGVSVQANMTASGIAIVSDLVDYDGDFTGLEGQVVESLVVGPKLGNLNRGC